MYSEIQLKMPGKIRELLKETKTQDAIREVIQLIDDGKLRCAEPVKGDWQINEWVKKAVVLYFPIQKMETLEAGIFEYHDKIPLKRGYKLKRVFGWFLHAVARHGAYISKGTILMPSYVNIGAYVDEGTMVDTWATVGSCAQIGKNVHLSGGVGIGGVLEPLQAAPVIIEDNAFIGSRCIVVEGVRVEQEAVLGANVVLTASTKIIDVTGDHPFRAKRFRTCKIRCNSRQLYKEISCRRISGSLCSDYWCSQSKYKQKNFPK